MGDAVGGARRQAVSSWLGTKTAAAIELTVVLAITLGHRVLRIIPVDETLPILLFGWALLWLRGVGWRGVGLTRPASWSRVIGLGVGTGVLLQILSEFVTEPVIAHLTGHVPDLSDFEPLIGNAKLALLYLGLVWSWVAFGEELTYRGYVLNRAADLGGRTNLAWILALAFVSGLFGFGHSYQGVAGVLGSTVSGLLFGGVYLASGRNLWVSIVAHGVTDTIGVVLIYLGFI